MSDIIPIDPLFRVPFATGLLIAGAVSLLGPMVRLRGEWLGALSYTQAAAAGAVIGTIAGLPPMAAAAATGAFAAILKAILHQHGNDYHGLVIVVGWTIMILAMANSVHASFIGQALIDGQLYFADLWRFGGALIVAVGLMILNLTLARKMLTYSVFAETARANNAPVRRHVLTFDVAVAIALGVAASTMGIMAAFALALLPAWITFAVAASWRQAVWLSVGLSLAAYMAAFYVALVLDQPFGPVFVATLVLLLPIRWLARRSVQIRE